MRRIREKRGGIVPRIYTYLHYHIVFSTKDRLLLVTPPVRNEIYRFVGAATTETGSVLKVSFNSEMKHLLRKHGIEFFENDFAN